MTPAEHCLYPKLDYGQETAYCEGCENEVDVDDFNEKFYLCNDCTPKYRLCVTCGKIVPVPEWDPETGECKACTAIVY